MRIYVAGRATRYHEAGEIMSFAERHGHKITYDWTIPVEQFGPNGNGKLTTDELCQFAERDRQGVRDAELVVILADADLAGAWIEMGIALEIGIPIWLVSPIRETVFQYLPEVTVVPSYVNLRTALQTGWHVTP